jgi:protein-disulfide isomerase
LQAFYGESYVKGNPDAKVTILEFSDFECPFCKRHDNQGTLEQVIEKYGDDVNVIFSHFPLSFHPLAQKAQEASECIGEQGGSDAFYAFKKAVFAEPKPTREAITKVAGNIEGIDVDAMETCIDEGKYAQKVTDAMNAGRKWGVTGTPGNLVIDNENGTLTKVSGAVPASAFDGPIGTILN